MIADEGSMSFAPLTEEEFAYGSGYTFRGIPIVEDEYGDWIFAWGHRNRREFARAVNDYDREMNSYEVDSKCTSDEVQHVWAITTSPPDASEGWFISWHEVTAETPQAFKLTVVSR